MKRQLSKPLVLATLVALPLLAHADHGRYETQGFSSREIEWRLGAPVSRVGHEILYRSPADRRWRRAPGEAVDVADGWVIGTDRRNGGYSIYRWNGYSWDRAPGAGVDIGGSYNNPWVVNDRGERFAWNGYDWHREGGYRPRDERRYGKNFRDHDDDRDEERDEHDRDEHEHRDWHDRH